MIRQLCLSTYSLWRRSMNSLINRVNSPVVVLMYHRVTSLSNDPQQLAISPQNFVEHIRFLSNYPILRFEDDWSNVRKPSIVITFDDGYADNALQAFPILEDFRVPATFFVNTGNIGTDREYWWDDLERLILLPHSLPDRFVLNFVGNEGMSWSVRDSKERIRLYSDLHALILRSRDARFCNQVVEQLVQWSGEGSGGRLSHRPMTLDELKILSSSTMVTIGGHGISHLPFSSLSPLLQHREIFECKFLLEKWTGRRINVFSYPFGTKSDYNSETVRLLKNAGFIKSGSNFPGQWRRWTSPFHIPRQVVRNWSASELESQLQGFWVS